MRTLLAIALAATLANGCGTTQIITNDPQARILVDGSPVGRGRAETQKRGGPDSIDIVVKTNAGHIERQQARRSFTLTTFLLGLITYGVCLIACWEYPDTVFVSVPQGPSSPAAGWGSPGADPWLAPPPGWQPRTPAP